METRLNFYAAAPDVLKALVQAAQKVEAAGLERGLLHLVKLRASQINGCSFCVEMHSREARADGESEQRLWLVAAWRESPLFTERERAALAWTEAATLIAGQGIPDALYAEARAQFSEAELVQLAAVVGMINMWNRMAIPFHAVHPVAKEAA